MLQKPFHQFAARIFRHFVWSSSRPRKQHLALDVDEHGSGIDKLAGYIHIRSLQLVDVSKKLSRDAGDRDVVNVNVLLADQVQQQIERSVVYLSYAY